MRNRLRALGAAVFLLVAVNTGAEAQTQEYKDGWDQWVREERAVEATLFDAFPEALVRDGGTLTIVADNGTIKVFEDVHCYCSDATYFHVIEHIPSLDSFVVWHSGYEWTAYTLVHRSTGASVGLSTVPVPDPSGTRFVAVAPGGYEAPSIEIGVWTGSGFTMEVDQTIDSNFTFQQWSGTDRVDLNCSPGSGTCTAFLRRQGGQWLLVASRSIPLPSSP